MRRGFKPTKKEAALSEFIKECMRQFERGKMLEIEDIIVGLNVDYERYGFKEGFMYAFDLWSDYIRNK